LLRKKALSSQEYVGLERTLLYAPDANWLWQYVHTPVEHVEELEPVSEDYVPFEELQKNVDSSEVENNDLEKLVQGASMGDYFVFERKENERLEEAGVDDADSGAADKSINAENISLYNDELMPYSFRWWLHKTRLEHAETYQPF